MNLSLSLKEKNRTRYLLLSLSGAVLLWLAWPPMSVTFLIFGGLVPLLFLEDKLSRKSSTQWYIAFLWFYLHFLVWNVLTTYWIYKATFTGAVFALIANALLMTIPFSLYHWIKKKYPLPLALLSLPVFWLAFEYIHFHWNLAWPWLTLGNSFASTPELIQWYEYTGVLGGTFWIWISNICLFLTIKKVAETTKEGIQSRKALRSFIAFLAVLIAPVILSFFINGKKQNNKTTRVVVVQPNVDPYNEKFDHDRLGDQINKLIRLSKSQIDPQTELVIWPETAISKSLEEKNLNMSPLIGKIRDFLAEYPRVNLVSGINSYILYPEKATPTARDIPRSDLFVDYFNTAIKLDTSQNYQIYHKTILVPGVEQMPYPQFFGFLEKLALDLGGISGSLGRIPKDWIFSISDSIKVAPVICYESVFGEYTGKFIRKGANLIVVITNDGWWGKTQGYKQHFIYAVLRAIEFRKSIARAANNGISAFITPTGEIHKKTEFWVEDAQKFDVPLRKGQTFYAKNGDYSGRISLYASGLLLIVALSRRILKRFYFYPV